ncbi:hypothetical protein [Hyalangium sp.]|uniref:hypothetical protein n=1 Tax=Hyalangium sp. TaxID=2028555 RepID=UPI002D24682C|nr:hypothetical protein [Hyalangium sp.]HYH96967.1 hypothetical protein [Hyalangium sp.]
MSFPAPPPRPSWSLTTSKVAVELKLEPTQGMPPWRAVRAELLGPGRRALRVKLPWQREPLRFDVEDKHVVVEADATDEELQGSFTLKRGMRTALGASSSRE